MQVIPDASQVAAAKAGLLKLWPELSPLALNHRAYYRRDHLLHFFEVEGYEKTECLFVALMIHLLVVGGAGSSF